MKVNRGHTYHIMLFKHQKKALLFIGASIYQKYLSLKSLGVNPQKYFIFPVCLLCKIAYLADRFLIFHEIRSFQGEQSKNIEFLFLYLYKAYIKQLSQDFCKTATLGYQTLHKGHGPDSIAFLFQLF